MPGFSAGKAVAYFVGLALIGGLGYGTYTYLTQTQQARGPGRPPGGFAVPIEAQLVKIDTARREAEAIGTLRSWESVVIRPEISGRIMKINFEEGRLVKKGDVLVELDRAEAEAEVLRAKAALELAKQNHERAAKLRQDGAGTAATLDRAQAELATAQAALMVAEAKLEKTRLVAPFDGVLGLRKASVGALLMPAAEIVNLEQIDQLKVDFRMPETLLASIKVGQSIRLRVDAMGNKAVAGTVYAIDPLLETGGRAIVIRARIPNPDSILRPGLFARVVLTIEERPNAVFVAEQAIVPASSGAVLLFKVVNAKPVLTPVELGERRKGEVEITRGLAAGDVVVTAGQLKLFGNPPPDVCLLPAGGPPGGPPSGTPPTSPSGAPAGPPPGLPGLPVCRPPGPPPGAAAPPANAPAERKPDNGKPSGG